MNVKERGDWLRAVGACLPDSVVGPVGSAAAALDAAGSGRWEVSVSGSGPHSIGLRFFGSGPYSRWRSACAEAFSLSESGLPDSPRPGFPWLAAAWDLKTGGWTALRLCGAEPGVRLKPGRAHSWEFKPGAKAPLRRVLAPVPFKAGLFREPVLDRVLEDLSRLCPLATFSEEEPGWSLRLARPLRWPMFARCDVSAAFTPSSSQLALFMLDRSVTELSFDGEALWAHCAG